MLPTHLLRKVLSRSGTRTRSRGSNDCKCNSLESAPSVLPTVDLAIPANLPVGGRLRYFWRTWQTFGASHRVVRWLRFGYPLPFFKNHRGLPLTPPLSVQPPPEIVTSYADPGKQALLNEQLDQLVAKQAIREIPHTDHVHFSRVFLVPKKNGKMRMVADLSRLNQWLQCPSFKMDNAQVVRDALLPDLWATSIDLTDAYLHIPIHPSCQKFLVFQVGNRRFMWLVLPFGLNTAPRVFSDVMKVLKQWGRTVGILLFQYLDDWLQLNMNAKILAQQTQQLIQQCMALGLLINHEKSDIVPMQRIVFLGDMLDFEQGFIFPTQARFEAIKDKIFRLTRHHDARFHVVRSLVGLLTATEKIVPFGRLHFRELQHFCNQQLAKGSVSSTRVVLPLSVLQDLDWWSTDNKVFNGLSMCQLIPDLQIQTDASTTGWGISFKGQVWSGT